MNEYEKMLLEEIRDSQNKSERNIEKLFEKLEDVDKRVVSVETKFKLAVPVMTMIFVSIWEFAKTKLFGRGV